MDRYTAACRMLVVAPCFFVLLLLAGCVGLPPKKTSSYEHYSKHEITKIYFLRGGRVPLFPVLEWLDTASVVRGARPAPEPGSFDRAASVAIPASGGGSIQWRIALATDSALSSQAADALLARLERASRLADQFDLVGNSDIAIELRLLEDGQSVDIVHRDYYLAKPELTFYLSAGSADDLRWAWNGPDSVLHELVHHRARQVAMSQVEDGFMQVREGIAASVVGSCVAVLGGLSETDVSAIEYPIGRGMPSDKLLLDVYREYGPSVIGQVVAGRWVFDGYIDNDGTATAAAVVKKEQQAEFSSRCSQMFEAAGSARVTRANDGLRVERGTY